MHNLFKKAVSVILSVTMCITACVPAFAETSENSGGNSSSVSSDYTVTGTNSFGNMMANVIDSEIEEQEENNGYNIFSVEVEDNKATVEYQTLCDSTIVVGIYEEDEKTLVTTGRANVTADNRIAEITFTEDLPQYFYIKAYLINSENMRPLGTVYENPNYTKEMQEFFAKKTTDFPADRVLNLDEDITNNFAVYGDNVKVIPQADGVNTFISGDNGVYKFENADKNLTSLKKGDIFAYNYDGNNVLIVAVDKITEDNGTVTITEADVEMDDVFEYVKIDAEAGMENTTVDTSALGDGIEYVGRKEVGGDVETASAYGIMPAKIEDEKTKTIFADEYKFADVDEKTDNASVKVDGKLDVSLTGTFKYYIALTHQYIEARLDFDLIFNVDINAEYSYKPDLGTYKISLIAGIVTIEITPQFIFEADVKANIHGEFHAVVGARADSDDGVKNLSSVTKKDLYADLNGSIYIGMVLKPKIVVVHEKIASVTLNGEAGIEVTGSMAVRTSIEKTGDSYHECHSCLEGKITGIIKGNFKAVLLNSKKLTFEKNLEPGPIELGKFYWSMDNNEFGTGVCPHYAYKVTFCLMDKNVLFSPIPGVTITVDCQTVKSGSGGETPAVYLRSGTYDVLCKDMLYKTAHVSLEVKKKPIIKKTIYLEQGKDNTGDTGDTGNTGDTSDTGDTGDTPDIPTTSERIKQVSLGGAYNAAITENGDLYTWGENCYGQLGDGTKKVSYVPKKIMSGVASVSLGDYHSATITTNGDLYTWGYNHNGQLGNGTTNESYVPKKIMSNVAYVSIGFLHSAAITKNGDLYTWGENCYGQLGNGTTTDSYVPKKIMSNVASVSLGAWYSAAITTNGDLYTWGYNKYGQIGDGTTKDRYVPKKIMSNVTSISLGSNHSAAITKNGDLYTWGRNNYGQLGNGTTDSYEPKKIMSNVVSVSLGNWHSAAITANGDLYTWGHNYLGQLGDGTYNDNYIPKKIMSNVACVNLGGWNSAAITTNGNLYTWGNNQNGELGDGTHDYDAHPNPTKIDIPPQTSTVSLALDTPIMSVPDMTEPTIEPEAEIIPEQEQTQPVETAEPMTIAETTDPNIVTDHTQAPAPTPDVYPETNQSFSGMLKNEVYYCYGMKSRTAADPFNSDNLLFIAQAISDSNGNLSFTYNPVENYPNAEVFVKAMTDFEVTNAEITGISESGDNISVTWNSVPSASKYTVYKVMNGVYIKAWETTGTSCTVTDITPNYAYKLVVTSCVNGEWSVPSDENAVYFMKTVEPEILLGDLNENGDLDDEDISMMKEKLTETYGTFEKIHDVNEDTYFDIRDLSALIYTIDHLTVT